MAHEARELLIHLGFNKTGSSYLQTIVANSLDAMEAQGVMYPRPANIVQAAKGNATTGNVIQFEELLADHALLDQIAQPKVLYSSEMIFLALQDPKKRELFADLFRDPRIGKVKILLFVRDPSGHASSVYQQNVKGGGMVATVDSFYLNQYSSPRQVCVALEFLETFPNVTVELHNYTVVKSRIFDIFADWCGLPREAFTMPTVKTVNRSLTSAELMLQMRLNERLGASGRNLTRLLVSRLPHIRPDDIRPSVAVQQALWERLRANLDFIDARLPEAERFDPTRDIVEPENSLEHAVFSREQIEVIGDCIAEAILLSRGENPAVLYKPAAKPAKPAKPARPNAEKPRTET